MSSGAMRIQKKERNTVKLNVWVGKVESITVQRRQSHNKSAHTCSRRCIHEILVPHPLLRPSVLNGLWYLHRCINPRKTPRAPTDLGAS